MIMQERRIMTGREGEAVVDHDGLDTLIESRRDGGILEAADHHDVIDERVLAAAQMLQLAARLVPMLRGRSV